MTQNKKISVIGLGAMGTALANTLIDQGQSITTWNRTKGKADELIAKGALNADTFTQACEHAHLVIICLINNDAVQEIIHPCASDLAGKTIVNLTNGTPEEARKLSAWASKAGIDYIDGGIMAIPPMLGTPHSLILYSGNPEAFETNKAALGILGKANFLGNDAGLAALFDLALSVVCTVCLVAQSTPWRW